jgi:enoyl-CoA hydratase/carnithine racemase
VAAVIGGAYGGGMEMLVNCDIIVASSDAKFSFPEVKRGVVAVLGGGFKQRAWSSDLLLILALRHTSHSAYMRAPGGFSVQYGQTAAF